MLGQLVGVVDWFVMEGTEMFVMQSIEIVDMSRDTSSDP